MPDLKGSQILERIDEAKSGTTVANRGALASILQDARRDDAVVVFKYDRLGRNLLDSLQTLRGLEDQGVHVYSTSEPNSEVVRNLLLTMAQEFSRQLGERCKRALDARAQAGHAANKPAFGYRIHRERVNGPGKFVIVPEEAKLVREIFKTRAKQRSLYVIVKELNARGIASPRGGLWQVGTVRAILRNEAYLGRVASGIRKFKKGHGLQEIRPRQEWIVCEQAHEPIVSLEIWQAVRELDRGRYDGRKTTGQKHAPNLWTGFVKCKHCGANLHRTVCGRAYLGCEGGRKTGQSLPCMCRYLVQEEEFSKIVLGILLDKVYAPESLTALREEIKNQLGRLSDGDCGALQKLESTHARLTQQIENAGRRLVHVAGEAQGAFLDELNKLKIERDRIKAQLGKARTASRAVPTKAEMEACIEKNLASLRQAAKCDDVAAARTELANHIEKIEVATDGSAWLYPKPAGLLAGLAETYQGNENIPTGI
jgi:DNA invertase Pin-like site-specific DNA recombinase